MRPLHSVCADDEHYCSPTLTAHGAGSTGLYRAGRKKRTCPKAVCFSPKPTWTSSVACGPICRACCARPIASRRHTATVSICFGAGGSRRCGAARAARRRKPPGQRDRADRDLYRPTLGPWRRLKLCRNDRCAVSLYDRSRNNSAVYHDSRECGNAIYLRASRARKRQGVLSTNEHPIDAEKP
jgi:hypothetical protein